MCEGFPTFEVAGDINTAGNKDGPDGTTITYDHDKDTKTTVKPAETTTVENLRE